MIRLDTPLSEVHGIGERFLSRLKTLGVHTVHDLLWYFPSRYEDYSTIYQIADLAPGQQATVQGVVEHIATRRTWQKRMSVVEAVLRDESGDIRAVWFNQPYLATTLKKGDYINLAGKVTEEEGGALYFSHPTFEKIRALRTHTQAPTHTARLVPIYPETRGLTSKGIRFLVQSFLKYADVPEWIPESVTTAHRFPAVNKALRDIHFPSHIEDAELARDRFSFEELFLLQLENLSQKQALAKKQAPIIHTDIEWLKSVLKGLPYELTETQKRSLWEIVKDIGVSSPMNRLLQGDVGSGKTVVAALAAIIAARAGHQTAFMAPTEVLANQHYGTLVELFKGIGAQYQPPLCLLTAGSQKLFYETDLESQPSKKELLEKISRGEVSIVIGTHALIQRSVSFKSLGLVIVDEQHRFGVRQRAALLRTDPKNPNTSELSESFAGTDTNSLHQYSPHFLSMSATPIPRTLMMTVFGDLDVSLITELPKGRQTITTTVVPPEKRREAYQFIGKKVNEGRQVFVICPRIESTADERELGAQMHADGKMELREMKAVKEEYEKLSKKVFPRLRVEMLHGKMKAKEKETVMKRFRDGEIDILVSTSVIEVGVDVPNAVIMMIEGADRFGLAQLYQFRGRVGRGSHQSYCLLFTDKDTKSAAARLRAITEAKNGFELAEYDLKIRGPGQFLGSAQTGLPDIAMQSLQNTKLVKASRDSASALLAEDPELTNYPRVKERLAGFRARLHLE